MDTFNLKKFLTENKLTKSSSLVVEAQNAQYSPPEGIAEVVALTDEVLEVTNRAHDRINQICETLDVLGWAYYISDAAEETDSISEEIFHLSEKIIHFRVVIEDGLLFEDLNLGRGQPEVFKYTQRKQTLTNPEPDEKYDYEEDDLDPDDD